MTHTIFNLLNLQFKQQKRTLFFPGNFISVTISELLALPNFNGYLFGNGKLTIFSNLTIISGNGWLANRGLSTPKSAK